MSNAIKARVEHWHAIFRGFTWRALVAVPFAMLGAFALVRDEFLPVEYQARLKMPSLLPDWRWQSWALCALVALLVAVLESSYREHAKLVGGSSGNARIDPKTLVYVQRHLDRCSPQQLNLLRAIDAVGIPDGVLVGELDPLKPLLDHDGRTGTGYAGLNPKLVDAIRQGLNDPARRRRTVRLALGTFMGEGQALMRRCADEQQESPNADADQWATEVEKFLSENLDDSFIARFRSGSGLAMAGTSIVSLPHRNLWGGLRVRVARLQEFIKENG